MGGSPIPPSPIRTSAPSGWPPHVPPPGAQHWERHATNWLLDLCPAEYRSHTVLTHHPLALAHMARLHVIAQIKASEQARATLRSRLTGRVSPSAVEETLHAVTHEYGRLIAALKAVDRMGEAFVSYAGQPTS